MLGHSLMLNQEEMVRRYREKIRLQVEEELRERRSQNHVEDTFSVPTEKIERPIRDERTTLEKAIGIPPIREDKNIISKAEEFDQAWRNVIHRGDCTLFDRIVHPNYYTENHGVRINKEQSRRLLLGRKGKAVMGPHSVIYENDEFLCIQRYSRVNLYTWFSMLSGVAYKNDKVYTQQTSREPLDNDPSKGRWDWEEYKSK